MHVQPESERERNICKVMERDRERAREKRRSTTRRRESEIIARTETALMAHERAYAPGNLS